MKEQDERELSEFLSDPMSVLFDLNEDMLEGMGWMRYALSFSFWAGGIIAFGSIVAALWLVFYERPEDYWWTALILALVAWVSGYACYSARAERPLLEDYWILGWGIRRANLWKPNPKIPEGPDAISRLVAHLKETDDRIGYILDKNPQKLQRDASVKGKSRTMHKFDLFMSAEKPIGILSDPVPEGIILMVRKVDRATLDDVKQLKNAAEDVLRRLYPCDQSARVILFQTGNDKFLEAAVDFADKNWMDYDRSIGDSGWSWSSPVELVAEGQDRTYILENMYFG